MEEDHSCLRVVVVSDPPAIERVHILRDRRDKEILLEIAGPKDVVVKEAIEETGEVSRWFAAKKTNHDDADRRRGSRGS